ncbi:MAG: hypothetical protein PVSMB7_14810 [Chloroflexota bacterium]
MRLPIGVEGGAIKIGGNHPKPVHAADIVDPAHRVSIWTPSIARELTDAITSRLGPVDK